MDDLLPNQPEQNPNNAISEADEAPSRRPNRSNAGGNGTKPDDPSADLEFVEFWMHYPRRSGNLEHSKRFDPHAVVPSTPPSSPGCAPMRSAVTPRSSRIPRPG